MCYLFGFHLLFSLSLFRSLSVWRSLGHTIALFFHLHWLLFVWQKLIKIYYVAWFLFSTSSSICFVVHSPLFFSIFYSFYCKMKHFIACFCVHAYVYVSLLLLCSDPHLFRYFLRTPTTMRIKNNEQSLWILVASCVVSILLCVWLFILFVVCVCVCVLYFCKSYLTCLSKNIYFCSVTARFNNDVAMNVPLYTLTAVYIFIFYSYFYLIFFF